MLYSFKIGTKNIAFESDSRMIFTLSELEKDVFDFTKAELPESCPSALRYALAKYDSTAIDAAYSRVYAIRTGKSDESGVRLCLTDTYNGETATVSYSKDDPYFAAKVIALANDGHETVNAQCDSGSAPDSPLVCAEYEKIAREIYKRRRMGHPFTFIPFVLSENDIKNIGSLSTVEQKRVECALFAQT